jgi:hypothetical protein
MRRHTPLVTYITHRQEKFHFSDGRRGVRFYLVDDGGNATPAVLGQERDACAAQPAPPERRRGSVERERENARRRGFPR